MNLPAIIESANKLLALLEAGKTGLRHRRHARHVTPARAAIAKVMRSYWGRQRAALVKEIKPHLKTLLHHFPGPIREASSPQGKMFANSLLPTSLHPLRFPVTKSESDDYSNALDGAILGAAKTLAKDLAAGSIESKDFAADYLRNNSLTKLTGDIAPATVDQLRNAVADAWQAGGSFDQIVKAIEDTFDGFSETRAQMIAQTEANDAYNAARSSLAADVGMDEKRWDPDGEACEVCEDNAAAGWIDIDEDFPSGDPEPTAHPNCFLGSTPVLACGITAAIRRWYVGPVCVLSFPGLPNLSVSPNHPILTRGGWVGAGSLNPGDDIAQCIRPAHEPILLATDPYLDQMEASIEQIFNALIMTGQMAPASVPLSPEAFHGDIQPDTKVEIVRANRSMRGETLSKLPTDPVRGQLSHQGTFGIRQRRGVALHADGPADEVGIATLAPTHGIVSSLGPGGPELWREIGIGDDLRSAVATLPEPSKIPMANDGNAGYPNAIRDCENAFSCEVGFVKLLEINVREFAGHVYNLSTQSGMYLANTIVAHNCDCGIDFRKTSADDGEE